MYQGLITGVIPRVLVNKEMVCSLVGWAIFLAAASVYCLAYNQFVLISPASFIDSFLWSLREYTALLLVTPLLFYGLRRVHRGNLQSLTKPYALLGLSYLLITLGIRLVVGHSEHSPLLARLVYVLPSHFYALGALTLLWHLFFRPARQIEPQQQTAQACDKVRVMKGNGEALISWAAVDFISAAGNYMELHCGAEQYLLRMPLKELEQLLPSQSFLRVHRSHIVNIEAIARIGTHPAGNGFIELRNRQQVPLSKGYKAALERLVPIPSKPALVTSSQLSDTHPNADA